MTDDQRKEFKDFLAQQITGTTPISILRDAYYTITRHALDKFTDEGLINTAKRLQE